MRAESSNGRDKTKREFEYSGVGPFGLVEAKKRQPGQYYGTSITVRLHDMHARAQAGSAMLRRSKEVKMLFYFKMIKGA